MAGCENRRAKIVQSGAEAGVGGAAPRGTGLANRRPAAREFRVGFPLNVPRASSPLEQDGRRGAGEKKRSEKTRARVRQGETEKVRVRPGEKE